MYCEPERVLSDFGPAWRGLALRPLRSTGFSGARLWRFSADAGEFCLRRWPDGQLTPERLDFIHRLLRHAAGHGFRMAPVPRTTPGGASFVAADGTLWQIEPWLPGEADFDDPPRIERIVAAFRTLAAFHVATDEFSGSGLSPGISGALAQRRTMLERCLAGELNETRRAIRPERWPELARRVPDFCSLFESVGPALIAPLSQAAARQWPLRPVIRDVGREHVLFTGDDVTGLVDFGAAAIDHVAVDLARLMGSYLGDDVDARRAALDAYQSVPGAPPLDTSQRRLIDLLDRSGGVLAAYRWLRWAFVEQREFTDRAAVVSRFDRLLGRLRGWRETAAMTMPD